MKAWVTASVILAMIAMLGILHPPSPRAAHAASRPTTLRIDLAASRETAAVGWPIDVKGEDWLRVEERQVEVLLPDGRTFSGNVGMIQYWRRGTQIRGVLLFSPAAELQPTYDRATALLKEWGLADRQSTLDAWHARRARDGTGDRDPNGPGWKGADSDPKRLPRIAIKFTFGTPNPWTVLWGVGFEAPPSQPTTTFPTTLPVPTDRDAGKFGPRQ